MHVLQVGAGSGGAVVADLITRDPRVTRVTLIEPDVYSPQNVHRHIFPHSAVGRLKAELFKEWVHERRPELVLEVIVCDLMEPERQADYLQAASDCDIGICAVDNEPAKYAFDSLMRRAGKPWTLGEVLSGGIGGWVHQFVPGGACYGCVASHLQRNVSDTPSSTPNYSDPGGLISETTIPAAKADIEIIAALHAAVTLELLDKTSLCESIGDFTSLLFTLKRVPEVFETAFKSFRFRISRSPSCLICAPGLKSSAGGNLDVALDEALDRLGPQ